MDVSIWKKYVLSTQWFTIDRETVCKPQSSHKEGILIEVMDNKIINYQK